MNVATIAAGAAVVTAFISNVTAFATVYKQQQRQADRHTTRPRQRQKDKPTDGGRRPGTQRQTETKRGRAAETEAGTESWLDRQVVGWIHINGTQIVICGVVVVHFLARQAGRQPQPEYRRHDLFSPVSHPLPPECNVGFSFSPVPVFLSRFCVLVSTLHKGERGT